MTKYDVARLSPEAIVGVLLTAIGGILLLDKLDMLHSLTRFWPIAIMGAGIALLLEQFDNPSRR